MARPEQPPDYVLLTPQSREALLSQWGVTVPAQRELFHKLCAQRRADIDPAPWPANDLEGLMTKLRDARVGLIVTKRTPEGRKWHKVLLTEEGSPRYWYHFLSEVYQNFLDVNKTFILRASVLQEKRLLPPENLMLKLAPSGVKRESMQEWVENERILRFTLSGDDAVISAKDYPLMINGCFAYLRTALQHQPNQIAVSRLLKTNLTEINRHLNNKEAGFWKVLTEVLIQNRNDLLGEPRQKWDQVVFLSAQLLGGMVESQLAEAQRAKDEERQREADMQAVVHALQQSPEGNFAPEEIKAVLAPLKEKYGDQYPRWEEEFYRRFTTDESPSGTGLPPIVVIKDSWLHRDKLYHYFVRHWDRLKSKIKNEMVERLKSYIEQGSHAKDLTFAKPENFENTLREMVEKEDEEVAWILKRPRILAEAAIALKKEVSAAEPLLSRFFKPGTMFFKRLSVLLDLDPEELYNAAFNRLSLFAQLWLFLSGKRNSYLNQVLEVAPRIRLGGREEGSSSVPPPASSQGGRKAAPLPQEAVAPVAHRHARAKPQAPQRVYSEREKNKAWKEFAQNIKKPTRTSSP